MSDNPEGTPNPLNPSPTEPVDSKPDTPEKPAEVKDEPAGDTPEKADESKQTTTTPDVIASEPAGSIVEPARKKSKKGLIICLVILLLALIGGGVAAAIIFLGPNGGGGGGQPEGDAVSKAITKIMKGEGAKNPAASGTLEVKATGSKMPFSKLSATFEGAFNSDTKESNGEAKITVDFGGGSDLVFSLKDVYDKNDNLFLKITSDSSDFKTTASTTVVDCAGAEDYDNCGAETLDPSSMISSVLAMISDKWIRFSASDISSTMIPTTGTTAELGQCIVNAVKDTSSVNVNLVSLYEANPFITSSTSNMKITKKNNALFKLGLDSDKLASFINSLTEKTDTSALKKCGVVKVSEVKAEDLETFFSYLPVVYVEINGDYNFTRLYVAFDSDDLGIDATLDTDLSYGGEVKVETPTEYIDFSKLFTNMYSFNQKALGA